MSEVLFSFMANGREKGKERFLCPVSPCWHTQAQMAAKISQQQRRQPKAVGRLLGLQARGQKWELWVVNVHFEKGEIGKRGNPWFWGCGVTWSQVVMASEWQLGAICQQELNDTTSAPGGAGEGHWPVGEGKSTLTSSLVCEWLRLFFPSNQTKKVHQEISIMQNGHLCMNTVQMSATSLPSLEIFSENICLLALQSLELV